jgi:hypothetical protein
MLLSHASYRVHLVFFVDGIQEKAFQWHLHTVFHVLTFWSFHNPRWSSLFTAHSRTQSKQTLEMCAILTSLTLIDLFLWKMENLDSSSHSFTRELIRESSQVINFGLAKLHKELDPYPRPNNFTGRSIPVVTMQQGALTLK